MNVEILVCKCHVHWTHFSILDYMDENVTAFVLEYLYRVLNITDQDVLEDIEDEAEDFYDIDLMNEEDDDYETSNIHGYVNVRIRLCTKYLS